MVVDSLIPNMFGVHVSPLLKCEMVRVPLCWIGGAAFQDTANPIPTKGLIHSAYLRWTCHTACRSCCSSHFQEMHLSGWGCSVRNMCLGRPSNQISSSTSEVRPSHLPMYFAVWGFRGRLINLAAVQKGMMKARTTKQQLFCGCPCKMTVAAFLI